jgi:hypothetical protein
MRRNSYQFARNQSLVDPSEAGKEINSTRVPIDPVNLNAVQRSRFAGFLGNLILENFERTKPTKRPKRGRRRLCRQPSGFDALCGFPQCIKVKASRFLSARR